MSSDDAIKRKKNKSQGRIVRKRTKGKKKDRSRLQWVFSSPRIDFLFTLQRIKVNMQDTDREMKRQEEETFFSFLVSILLVIVPR